MRPNTVSEIRKLSATAAMPMSAPRPGVRFPKKTIRKKATSGTVGMSQACSNTVATASSAVATASSATPVDGAGPTLPRNNAREGPSHACAAPRTGDLWSPLQEIDFVDVDRLSVAVDEDDDGQADADLGSCDGNHEEREHLAAQHRILEKLGERHEIHVDGIQHHLDGHQNQHGVSPGQHSIDADREQHRREQQDERQTDHASSFRART